MEYEWNTGRLYTATGQRIKAIQIEGGDILFADLSRGIDGRIPNPGVNVSSLEEMRRIVMATYDKNAYKADEHSWGFHMMARK
jgi:hypothetical protein